MADIRPFPGIRYNPKKVDNLDKVVTQPYDKVTPKMQDAYLESDPHSFVQLILSKEADPYESSALLCRQWLKDRTLLRDRAAAVYVLHEEFEHGGKKLLRKGFVAAIRVEEFDKGTVLPHELTLSKPKADRLSLLRATQKDYEQIFMLYSDPEAKVDSALAVSDPPDMQAKDEYGVVHKMWFVNDKDKLAAVGMDITRYQVIDTKGKISLEFVASGPALAFLVFLQDASASGKYWPVPSLTIRTHDGTGSVDVAFQIGYEVLDGQNR